jgi:hypothetical protein
MRIPPRFRQFLQPSLGKAGLAGMALCLALGIYAPRAQPDLAQAAAQPRAVAQPQMTAQAAINPRPRR